MAGMHSHLTRSLNDDSNNKPINTKDTSHDHGDDATHNQTRIHNSHRRNSHSRFCSAICSSDVCQKVSDHMDPHENSMLTCETEGCCHTHKSEKGSRSWASFVGHSRHCEKLYFVFWCDAQRTKNHTHTTTRKKRQARHFSFVVLTKGGTIVTPKWQDLKNSIGRPPRGGE